MNFGDNLRKFLSDSANTVSNYFGNAANAVGNEVQQLPQQVGNAISSFTQPQIQSPVPQAQTIAPQQPNWLQNISSFGQSLLNGAGQQANYFMQGKNVLGQQEPFGINNPFAPAPRLDLTSHINTGNPITDWLAKTAVGIPQSILNSPADFQKAVPQDIQDIKSGDIFKPQVAASDVASTAMPIANVALLGEAPAALEGVNAAKGLIPKVVEGVAQGAKYGGLFGAGSGLESGRDINDPLQYAGNLASNTAQGVGAGALFGGITGGISALPDTYRKQVDPVVAKQVASDINAGDPAFLNNEAIAPYKRALSIKDDPKAKGQLVNAINDVKTNGMIGDSTANNILTTISQKLLPKGLIDNLSTPQLADTWDYLLSRVNGAVPENVPPWMSKFDGAVFDVSGNKALQAGFIKVPGLGEEKPEEVPSKLSLKEQLTQPPLPAKMSQKAIDKGLEFPVKGSDISVSPQAQMRYRIVKNAGQPVGGNPEPLPWEAGNQPQAVGDILKGGKYKFDEGLGTSVSKNPPEPKEPFVTNPNGTVKQARESMYAAQAPILERGKVLQQLAKEGIDTSGRPKEGESVTNYGENKLFRQAVEHPEMKDDISQQVKNPDKFNKAVEAFENFTDHAYSQFKDAGSRIGFLNDYYSHILDLSKPGEAERLQAFTEAKAKNFKGWYNKVRTFKDIEELEANGFELKNKNVVDDINEYTNAVSRELGGRVLSSELQKMSPKEVYISNGDASPANMYQSRIPGMKGTYLSKNLLDQLKDLEPQGQSKLGGLINKGQQGIKQTKLAGGLFHIQNTGADYLAGQLGLGKVPRLDKAVRVFLSPGEDAKYRQENIESGLTDKAAKMQVTFSTEHDINKDDTGLQKVSKGINKFNPFTKLNDATFSRLEDFFKMETVKALDKRGLLNTDTPEGLKVAKDYGRQINNMFGGQNRVAGDDVFNKNPVTKFIANNALLLAPDYQQGRFKRTFSALNPNVTGKDINIFGKTLGARTGANNFALGTLALRIAGTAVISEALRRAVTGKFNPNLIAAIQNDVISPNFPSPWKNTSSSGNKTNQIVHLSGTNAQDLLSLASDPEHFLISHLPGGTSDALSYLSNQDYYGNKLSDTNNPLEKGLKLTGSNLPIPVVQAQKVLSGKEAVGNALLNFAGNRVSTDPNDPTQVYFKNLDAARSSLTDPTQQKIFDAVYARERDINGNSIPMTPANRMANAMQLLNNPQVLAAITKSEQATAEATGKPINPLYNMSPTQQKIVLEYESQLPGPERTNALYVNNNLSANDPNRGLLLNFFNQQQQFYNQLPASNNPNKTDPSLVPPSMTAYVQQQLAAKNYTDPQVKAYLTADTAYKNAVRGTVGAPLLSSFGTLPADEAKYNAQAAQRQNSSLFRTLSRKVKSQHSLSIKSKAPSKGKSFTVKTPTTKISGKFLSLKGKPFSLRTKFS